MKYLVEVTPTVEKGNEIDAKGGPGPVFSYVNERFKPQAIYLNATKRQAFLIVDLGSEADLLELSVYATQVCGAEPKVIPLTSPDTATKALAGINKAPRF